MSTDERRVPTFKFNYCHNIFCNCEITEDAEGTFVKKSAFDALKAHAEVMEHKATKVNALLREKENDLRMVRESQERQRQKNECINS